MNSFGIENLVLPVELDNENDGRSYICDFTDPLY